MPCTYNIQSTIVALTAITSLLLPVANKVNWATRTLWYCSTLSAFLSVVLSCKHQQFIGNLILTDEEEDNQRWLRYLHDENNKAKPQFSVVLLLSGTSMFFDLSLCLYIIGLAVYLGCLMTGNIDPDTGESDSRNIFILFLVFTTLVSFVHLLLDHLVKTGPLQKWKDIRSCIESKVPAFTMRRKASVRT